jgi:RepB DNA-primase from phage plasmid
MTAQVDEGTVRQFLQMHHHYAASAINSGTDPGLLQLVRIHPDDESISVSRYVLGDTDRMAADAIAAANAGHNVYVEGRTVRKELRGNKRGGLEDTLWVFALVADCDADKGKAGNITITPTFVVATSPGNRHCWFVLAHAVTATHAKAIGDAMRASFGADQDTGVVTQCYRLAGTPNFPSRAKRARGRIVVEPTAIALEPPDRPWEDTELLAHIAVPVLDQQSGSAAPAQPVDGPAETPPSDRITEAEATLPDDLLEIIRNGAAPGVDRSELFHKVIANLERRNWTTDAIVELFERYPDGIAEKYRGRVRQEVERSYGKVAVGPKPAASAPAASGAAPAASTSPAGPIPAPAPHHVIPTIRIVAGRLPEIAAQIARALMANGAPIFVRGGMLVEPVTETTTAADGRKTVSAKFSSLTLDSLLWPIADAAIFQVFNRKRNAWVDVDPPLQLVRMVLAGERQWPFPRVSGNITTPTLRADGSLLAAPGYDAQSGLYLQSTLQLSPIPGRPTKEQARAALDMLIDLLSEFPFAKPSNRSVSIDRSVALAGLLTAHVRGSLPTAPVILVRADTPGTGKSYLVDVFAMLSTGRLCPVITASRSAEETEKRLGAVLLGGTNIVSLDNVMHDLGGELLCQLSERPVIKVRILGRSEMPECESHTAVFATGNNVAFKGDMVRRGLVCNLEALIERPELREFTKDALDHAANQRGAYVAAVLTIIRAYLEAGAPRVCGPLGSYAAWSQMVRSPLVWLGEPDPIGSMDAAREEDEELSSIREYFDLWENYDLDIGTDYTSSRIVEAACMRMGSGSQLDLNPRTFEQFLLRIAADKNGKISASRLGSWMRKISGRIVAGHRLVRGRDDRSGVATFRLERVNDQQDE